MLKVPKALYGFVKEGARHVLRRPVVGVVALAASADGRYVLIRRADTGQWALPGGTVEWGETLQRCIRRELAEEAGVEVISLGELVGLYSRPDRDFRFHAVTAVVRAKVTEPLRKPSNPVEITEVGLFQVQELPSVLSHQMSDMLSNALAGKVIWE
jgi:8-oxo-dGTP diphosphatase